MIGIALISVVVAGIRHRCFPSSKVEAYRDGGGSSEEGGEGRRLEVPPIPRMIWEDGTLASPREGIVWSPSYNNPSKYPSKYRGFSGRTRSATTSASSGTSSSGGDSDERSSQSGSSQGSESGASAGQSAQKQQKKDVGESTSTGIVSRRNSNPPTTGAGVGSGALTVVKSVVDIGALDRVRHSDTALLGAVGSGEGWRSPSGSHSPSPSRSRSRTGLYVDTGGGDGGGPSDVWERGSRRRVSKSARGTKALRRRASLMVSARSQGESGGGRDGDDDDVPVSTINRSLSGRRTRSRRGSSKSAQRAPKNLSRRRSARGLPRGQPSLASHASYGGFYDGSGNEVVFAEEGDVRSA